MCKKKSVGIGVYRIHRLDTSLLSLTALPRVRTQPRIFLRHELIILLLLFLPHKFRLSRQQTPKFFPYRMRKRRLRHVNPVPRSPNLFSKIFYAESSTALSHLCLRGHLRRMPDTLRPTYPFDFQLLHLRPRYSNEDGHDPLSKVTVWLAEVEVSYCGPCTVWNNM
jgi:hypothetical protein